MKVLFLALILGIAPAWLAADEGADVPLGRFKICAREFLEAVAAGEYDRAFDMLDQADIRIGVRLEHGDASALLAQKRRRFFEDAEAFAGFASWAITSKSDFMAVRHDDRNVTVWVPMPGGRLVVNLCEMANGQVVVGSFSAGAGPVLKGPRVP